MYDKIIFDMENNILFIDDLRDFGLWRQAGRVLHVLCTAGNMSFMFRDVRYNVAPADYVILPNVLLSSGFSGSADFAAVVMGLSESYVASMAIRSNYGVIGHLSLLQNPVMRLSDHDFRVCLDGMTRLRERQADATHLFRDEMLGCLLTAHILDLYDIHARCNPQRQVSEHTARLLRRFVEMLYRGDYATRRDLDYYASELCVTPHYLSEVCRKACGRPASYWIDRFTLNDITRLLVRKDVPLAAIAERFSFSSLSYFSRYVQKRLGKSPSEYRKGMNKKTLQPSRRDGA